MPIKGVEQLDIERINSYEDNRFSEKVLRQHGAFVVNGIFFYEVLITRNIGGCDHRGKQEIL